MAAFGWDGVCVGCVAILVGVWVGCGVGGKGEGLFDEEGVGLPVDCWVDSQAEEVLVVGG